MANTFNRTLLFLLYLLFAGVAVQAQQTENETKIFTEPAAAMQNALKAERSLLLMHLSAGDDPFTLFMQEHVFNDPDVQGLRDIYTWLQLDLDNSAHRAFLQQHGLQAVPGFVIMDARQAKGVLLRRHRTDVGGFYQWVGTAFRHASLRGLTRANQMLVDADEALLSAQAMHAVDGFERALQQAEPDWSAAASVLHVALHVLQQQAEHRRCVRLWSAHHARLKMPEFDRTAAATLALQCALHGELSAAELRALVRSVRPLLRPLDALSATQPNGQALCAVLNSVAQQAGLPAQDQCLAANQPANQVLSFFVTSTPLATHSNLGGLAGADAHCQRLAAAVGAGQRVWRAYLSALAADGVTPVHARDRIGQGPWRNAEGVTVAGDVQQLHGAENGLSMYTALTEHGETVPGRHHDMLTGSDPQGRLAQARSDVTCGNWTSNSGTMVVGHHNILGGGDRPTSWNSSHIGECGNAYAGSNNLFYCFASDAPSDPSDNGG